MIDAVKQVTGKEINVVYSTKRSGDPEILVADPTNIVRDLNWYPKFGDLATMIKHAWQ